MVKLTTTSNTGKQLLIVTLICVIWFKTVVFKLFFVRVPPDIISLQLCTPKVVGTVTCFLRYATIIADNNVNRRFNITTM
jgi:hypothetical protein